MEGKAGWIDIGDLTGGLNDTAPPSRIRDNQLTIAENVEFRNTPVLQRRRGYSSSNTTWAMSSIAPVKACSLIRHIPTGDPRAAELWMIDDSNGGGNPGSPVFGRLAASTAFASVTLSDNLTPYTDAIEVYGASLKGKLFLTYNSAVDRMHVWDPDAGQVRRIGLSASAVPTVANTGAGAYPATIRYYKIRWADVVSGSGTRFGEWSAAVSFTPSGAGTAARVTYPALPFESEDTWQVAASADGVNYYNIATIGTGTTFWDDSLDPSTYSTYAIATSADTYTTVGSAKYPLADINRLILAGSWETVAYNSRVFYSQPIGATGQGYDEEYFPSDNYLDLDPGNGGAITGMVSLAGVPHVFKLTHIWQLVRTGVGDAPYKPENLSRVVGAIRGKTIVEGEDSQGVPCLYFLSVKGPYRLIAGQPQYLGRDIETIWSTVNLDAGIPHHAVWHGDRGQVRFYVAVSSATLPNRCLVYHVESGGWTVERYGSSLSTTRDLACSVMFSRVAVGAAMSIDLKPWVGNNVLLQMADIPTAETDAAFGNYRAYARTKAMAPFGPGKRFRLTQLHLLATVAKTLTASLIRDFGNLTVSKTQALPAAVGTEDRVYKRVDDLEISECQHVQIEIGDSAATSGAWAIDLLRAEVAPEQTSHT